MWPEVAEKVQGKKQEETMMVERSNLEWEKGM